MNEDRSVVDVRGRDYHLFVVLDGHGGPHCASFCEGRVAQKVKEHRDRYEREAQRSSPPADESSRDAPPLDWPAILTEALEALDGDFERNMARTYPSCGSCCILCVVVGMNIYTACVGDSRAVVCRRQRGEESLDLNGLALSQDQDCKNKEECEEVRRRTADPDPLRRCSGGPGAPLRVAGSLMVTRALGDFYLKDKAYSWPPFRQHVPYISGRPVITEHTICTRESLRDVCIVLASDGLYNVLSDNEIAQIACTRAANPHPHLASPSQLLIDTVLERVAAVQQLSVNSLKNVPAGPNRRKLHDDVTVICVHLGGNCVHDPASDVVLSEATRVAREAQLQRASSQASASSQGDVSCLGDLQREASTVLFTESMVPKRDASATQDDDAMSASSHNSGRGLNTSSSSGGSSYAALWRMKKKKPSPPPQRAGM